MKASHGVRVHRDERRGDRDDPARGEQPLAPADPGPDGDRLLGQAPHLDADLGTAAGRHHDLLHNHGLVLGIDFEGGVAWDVPAGQLSVDDARQILSDNGLESDTAKIQERNSDSGDIIKVQVADQPR